MNHQTLSVPQYLSRQASTQPMIELPYVDSGLDVPVFSPGDDPIAYLIINQATIQDGKVTVQQISGDTSKNYLTEDLDTYDSDCDDVSNAKAVLMANISNYGFDNISEVAQIVLWYLDSGFRFGNDQISRIMRYGDYQLGNVAISRVYYVDGLGHNLFSVRQFCDADLEVAFWKNTYALFGNLRRFETTFRSGDTTLYTISLEDMQKTSSDLSNYHTVKREKDVKHRRYHILTFCTLNKLAKDSLARGIPKLKFQKDHLCSACVLGKSKISSHQPKAEDTNQEKLYILHMDLCGSMCVASINDKSYILVIVNDYSRFTWIMERICQSTLREFYENVGISHQTSVAHTPRQNGVVERRNRTLVEAARTMLIFYKASLFLWAEDLGKLDVKADIGIFVGYAPAKKAFRIYNRRTQKIIETIHVMFDELTTMASEQFSSGPALLQFSSNILVQELRYQTCFSQQPCIPPNRDDWDHLLQPMFDEYFNPPTIVVSLVQEAAAPRAVVLADSLVLTSIDQDAPSASIPSTQEQEHSLNISQGLEESPKTPFFHDDPLHESLNEDSTSQGSSSNVRQTHTPFEHLGRWTKDHPIANMIRDPSLSVSTRKQLETDAMWCYFDAFLTSIKPKNYKQAMIEPSWIDAMQEEIHEFERLEV
ncbi:retrovirus-related pol polyprotein from transposon TNT 1-94 [Tanacetum coccineum]